MGREDEVEGEVEDGCGEELNCVDLIKGFAQKSGVCT